MSDCKYKEKCQYKEECTGNYNNCEEAQIIEFNEAIEKLKEVIRKTADEFAEKLKELAESLIILCAGLKEETKSFFDSLVITPTPKKQYKELKRPDYHYSPKAETNPKKKRIFKNRGKRGI